METTSETETIIETIPGNEVLGDDFYQRVVQSMIENQAIFFAPAGSNRDEVRHEQVEVASFRSIAIPLVRRVYPQLITDPVRSVNYMIHHIQGSHVSYLPDTHDWSKEGF